MNPSRPCPSQELLHEEENVPKSSNDSKDLPQGVKSRPAQHRGIRQGKGAG